MKEIAKIALAIAGLSTTVLAVKAEVKVPNIFSSHMVLQRNMKNPVWGKADRGEKVTVTIAGQSHKTVADTNGDWRIKLDSMKAGGPHTLVVKGKNTLSFDDVLVGEVWICSGQSNMQFAMKKVYHSEVEFASANYPQIRLLSVPNRGTQEPQFSFDGSWKSCSAENLEWFSAIGYFFGRRLHNTLGVPVGLINNAWGGSDLEAWLPRNVLEDAGQTEYLAEWDQFLAGYTDETVAAKKAEYKKWLADGKPGKKRWPARDIRKAQKRPSNIYNGVLKPTIGYGIKGVIWYQGESNVSRAHEYRSLFPLMINTWRDLWGQGDFPFYWVQLADFSGEDKVPKESFWAELREAQTSTLNIRNTGEAVILDVGEGRDIHPRDKQTVASRLVRHALAKDYGFKMKSDSPRYNAMSVKGNTVTITFDHIDKGLFAFDTNTVKGFAIAGKDKKFVWADAKIIGKNKVRVSSDKVSDPVAVRYGWAHNPVVNLYDLNGLPVTPFRTDDWPGVTVGKKTVYR